MTFARFTGLVAHLSSILGLRLAAFTPGFMLVTRFAGLRMLISVFHFRL